ncbi:MAG: hypothetical protein B7Y37_00770 [Sphingobacteriia bacterium 28-36-52]|nr:MAG: hypothetical protein B7Y37_00770 [Sphingobacteriia bacterium 28-36-52]
MRLVFTLSAFLMLSICSSAQKITGIWRGYFSSSNGLYREGIQEEMYKYEIQIDQQPNNGLKGVTYSYKSTVFYGKASFQGIYNVKTKTIILKENSLIDLKIGDKSEPCLMTCYLDYSKMGKLEVLQGTFISINIKDKGDCGNGKIYLERVPDSDFEKEAFLSKKNSSPNKSATKKVAKPIAPNPKPTITNKANTLTNKIKPKIPNLKPATPSTKDLLQEQNNTKVEEPPVQPHIKREHIETQGREKRTVPVPKVLQERENKLVKTIVVDEENIQVDLFDNGTIDNDTISVFHNNKQIIKHGRLAFNPISIKIKCSTEDNLHELVVVAENLGEIPPNTALMVITAGKKRYEVFLTSNESRNAKVVIEFIPKH